MIEIAAVSLTALTVILTAVTISVFAQGRKHSRELEARVAAVRSRIRKSDSDALQAEQYRQLLEQSVDGGAQAVEVIHRAISETTFSVVDRLATSERIRTGSRQARDIHDQAATGVYRSIRTANKQIHALADIIRKNRP